MDAFQNQKMGIEGYLGSEPVSPFLLLLTPDIHSLKAHNRVAASIFGQHLVEFLARESFNQEIWTEALLQVLRRVIESDHPHGVIIQGITPITERLCRRIEAFSKVKVSIADEGQAHTAQRIFDRPVISLQALDEQDVVVSATIEPWRSERFRVPSHQYLGFFNEEVRQIYRKVVEQHQIEIIDNLNASLQKADRLVFFIAKKVYFNQLRASKSLQRKGWRTVSIVLDSSMKEHNYEFFDEVFTTDLCTLLRWLNQANGAFLHTQGWLFRYHIPVLIDVFKPPSCRQIVEMMDLNSFWFPLNSLDQSLDFMRKVWGEDCEKNHMLQCACEKYIYENADGVIFPGDEGHKQSLRIDDLGRDDRYLFFMTYPLRDFFASPFDCQTKAKPPDIRLVFAGGVTPISERRVKEIFVDAQMLVTARHIVSLGLKLDIYNNPLIAESHDYPRYYAEHLELQNLYPNYRFLMGELPWKITHILAQYDYGLMIYDFHGLIVGENHFKHLIPTKLFMYLEAGLPVLVSDRWKAVCELVDHYEIGKSISYKEYLRLPQVLEKLDPNKMKQNVLRVREILAMDNQIERLSRFYASCCARKPQGYNGY